MALQLSQPTAMSFVPDSCPLDQALARTTHLGIGAHPDDLEFMAWHPILQCFSHPELWLSGVIVSDGRSSPRAEEYAGMADDEMVKVRLKEQQHAAVTGEYSALISLMHSETGPVMGRGSVQPLVDDLMQVLQATRPRVLFTHNLADSHPHHQRVVLAVIAALRRLGPEYFPAEFYGGEVWRSLDWMTTADKRVFDVSAHQNLTQALMGVYDSQISGGKRYDQATAGRKRANATYYDPLSVDPWTALEYAMDLRPLLEQPHLRPADYVCRLIDNFAQEVRRGLENAE